MEREYTEEELLEEFGHIPICDDYDLLWRKRLS